MSATEVAAEVAQEAALHHEAFLIEIFGETATTPDRLNFLKKKGYIRTSDVGKLGVKTPVGTLDPVEFVMKMSQVMTAAEPENVEGMRRWPLTKWIEIITNEIKGSGTPTPDPPIPMVEGKPLPPTSPVRFVPRPKTQLGTAHQAAYEQASTRAGEYVRGLGNKVGDDGRAIVLEGWKGEEITTPVDQAKRAQRIDDIRTEVAEGIARGDTAQKVKSQLGHKSGEWARDWERIAKTEMQGAYNDGQIIRAIKVYGDRARVARIPEPTACQYCKNLFLEGSTPIIFGIQELIENGTNVGRKASQWRATIWPVHPNCRCDTQVVPPGFTFNDEWILVPE